MQDWKVIISRKSGSGKAGEAWDKVSGMLRRKGVSFSEAFTEYKSHAVELTKQALKDGYRKIMTLGGDGAIHEILNGVMAQDEVPTCEVTLAIIPVGSGNDWPRLHNIPKHLEQAVEVIASGRTMLQDVVKVESVMDGKPHTRYMINIGGLGFDSQICRLFDKAKQKGRHGDVQYLKCLLKGFVGYKSPRFSIKVDGEPFYEGTALSVALGNGRYCGGGMMQTPQAVCNDGILDVTVIKNIWKLKLLPKIKELYKGTILQNTDFVFTAKSTKCIEIAATPSSYIEIDGEYCGCSPVRASIVPSAVNVITNI